MVELVRDWQDDRVQGVAPRRAVRCTRWSWLGCFVSPLILDVVSEIGNLTALDSFRTRFVSQDIDSVLRPA